MDMTMMAWKSKIDINDIRADKGGNPDIYRRALALAAVAVVGVGSPSESESYIDEALSLDSQRRSSLTNLEGLRSKLSNLQITVIAPKKKASEDITLEVEQLKQWKLEIAKLSKEVNDLELKRDAAIASINMLLEKCNFEDLESSDGVEVASTMQEENGSNGNQSLPLTKQPSLSVSAKTFTPKSQLIPSEEAAASESPPALPILSQDEIKSIPPERILNLNVGVLGHVDTGKTSLVKTLSSILSTAALDKSQQSRTRGITLDLGFSAFLLPLPEHMRTVGNSCSAESNRNCKPNGMSIDNGTSTEHSAQHQHHDLLQITLVDCPGHASLIRTIIGGAQIIDMILLVVDATKGMQTQTAECLVIAEMTTRNLIVVLNKIDLFPENEREERVRLAEKKMRAALRGTKFENAQMVGISACIGGEKVAAVGGNTSAGGGGGNAVSTAAKIASTSNIHGLLDLLQSQIRPPNRDALSSPDRFHFAVDHCFPIKGQGTVLTGTVLSGSARPNDIVEFPTLSTQKKIKGLQMFRRKANIIQQGDRAGICVSNFDAKLMERGIIASPGTVKLIRGAIAVVRKVRFFKGALNSGSKFHVSVGHTTVMATVTFWGAREIAMQVQREEDEKLEERNGSVALGKSSLGGSADLAGLPRLKFDWNQDFLHQENYIDILPASDRNELTMESESSRKGDSLPPLHWARLEFLTPVYCPMDSLVIGSRLDTEVNANACRLAFSGRLVEKYDAKSVSGSYQTNVSYPVRSFCSSLSFYHLSYLKDHNRLKSYTRKERVGIVDRLGDPYRRNDDNKLVRYDIFGTDLFKKETNMKQFVGLLIETKEGDVGIIQSSFGNSGKFRVNFPGGTEINEGDSLFLRFKRYANDPKKAIHQDGSLPLARAGTSVDLPVKTKKKNKNKSKNGSTSEPAPAKVGSVQGGDDAKNRNPYGEVEKVKGELLPNDKYTVAIVSGLFSMEDDITQHKGRRVCCLATDEEGVVDGSFGKMGKCKVYFKEGISAEVGSRVQMADVD